MMAYPRTHALFDSSFGGITMRQYWADLPLWENFLNAHSVRGIVEIGAGRGGMTLFLAAQAAARGQSFYTMDRERPEALDTPLAKLLNLEDSFMLGDIWEHTNERLIFLLRVPEIKPVLLFIDGGCKRKEFAAFVPALSPGDFVAVHDYGTEFQPEHVEPVAEMVVRVFWEECEAWPRPCLTRFWRRI